LPPYTSNLSSRQVFSPPAKADYEYTTRLAPSPRFLRHAGRDRAVAGPTLPRRRAAPHRPVRPAHRDHPGQRLRAQQAPTPLPRV